MGISPYFRKFKIQNLKFKIQKPLTGFRRSWLESLISGFEFLILDFEFVFNF